MDKNPLQSSDILTPQYSKVHPEAWVSKTQVKKVGSNLDNLVENPCLTKWFLKVNAEELFQCLEHYEL